MISFFRKIRTFLRLLKQNITNENGLFNFIRFSIQQIQHLGLKQYLHFFKQVDIQSHMSYDLWRQLYDSSGKAQQRSIEKAISQFASSPLISVVIPVYNPSLEHFTTAVDSIINQLYPHWELCLVDDASTDPEIKPIIQQYCKEDPRIKAIFRSENGHISAATNDGIDHCSGDIIAFVDHDDLLTTDALFWVAYYFNQHPDAQIFYSDEDKLRVDGKLYNPHFKSDFNYELFLAYNYFNHLTAIKKSLINKVGGLRLGLEGAQDYDLLLRCLDYVRPNDIIHCPKVLYHWREATGSTALDTAEKPYIQNAGIKALSEHFERRKIRATVTFRADISSYITQYTLTRSPLVSIIIPTKNAHELVKQCLESLYQKTVYPNFEVILIDNNSDNPESLATFAQFQQHFSSLTLIHDHTTPFNYAKINNNAVEHASGEFILFLNNDIEVINPEWLSQMVAIALQDNVGAVGAKLYYSNDTLQHAGIITGIRSAPQIKEGVAEHAFKGLPRGKIGYFARTHLMQNYSAVTAACLLVSKINFLAVNGFNDIDLKVAYNDLDFCLKLQKIGLRNVWTPNAELYHYESITRGADDETPEKAHRLAQERDYMFTTWQLNQIEDPFYNPNLSAIEANFTLAEPRNQLLVEIQ